MQTRWTGSGSVPARSRSVVAVAMGGSMGGTETIGAVESRESEVGVGIGGRFGYGIDQGDGYKIRWPQVNDVDEGTIRFAVDVPEGTVFHVMYGTRESQVESARRAAHTAVDDADGEVAGAFVYDCACRSNILGDEFETAVTAMGEEFDAPFAGFETYGEICMQPGQMSGFHNTTTVILLFPG